MTPEEYAALLNHLVGAYRILARRNTTGDVMGLRPTRLAILRAKSELINYLVHNGYEVYSDGTEFHVERRPST